MDGGYFSGSELKKAEEKGYSVLTPTPEKVGKSTKKGQNTDKLKRIILKIIKKFIKKENR